MASSEEFMAPADQSQIARGKRTKRPRKTSHSPPSPAAITTTSISISNGLESLADDDRSSYGSATTTDEEEDMANCLILLAQGGGGIKTTSSSSNGEGKNDAVMVENGNSSKDHTSSYECKTCNKSFHSFQALGGHRASHKKPKLSSTSSNNEIIEESKSSIKTNNTNDNIFISNPNSSPTNHKSSLTPSSSTSKVHECSICGSEFSSGQALGGHMRRHRTTAPVISSLKPRSMLSLDLNLPAPEDDDHLYRESEFHHQFATNHKRPFEFSAPSLVDCHY